MGEWRPKHVEKSIATNKEQIQSHLVGYLYVPHDNTIFIPNCVEANIKMTGECRIGVYVEVSVLGLMEEPFPIYLEWLKEKAYWIFMASRFCGRTVLVSTLDNSA
jgi:hypothetical protein